MYKSPIIVDYVTDIFEKIQEEQELKVLGKVNAEISVNKEELIKALAYDRNQYEKGYADGHADGYAEAKSEIVTMVLNLRSEEE